MPAKKPGSKPLNRLLPPDPSAWALRNVTFPDRRTTIKLENVFWSAVDEAAADLGISWRVLVIQIGIETRAVDPALPLSRAIRVWLFQRLQGRLLQAEAPKLGDTL